MHLVRNHVKALAREGGDAAVEAQLHQVVEGIRKAQLAAKAQVPVGRLHLFMIPLAMGKVALPRGLGVNRGDLRGQVQEPAVVALDERQQVEVGLKTNLEPAGRNREVIEVPAVLVQDLRGFPCAVRSQPIGAAIQVKLALTAVLEARFQGDEAAELVTAEYTALDAPVADAFFGDAGEGGLPEGRAAAQARVPAWLTVFGDMLGRSGLYSCGHERHHHQKCDYTMFFHK